MEVCDFCHISGYRSKSEFVELMWTECGDKICLEWLDLRMHDMLSPRFHWEALYVNDMYI